MAIEEELELNIEEALEAVDLFAVQIERALTAFSQSLAAALVQIFETPQQLQAQLQIDPGDSGDVVADAIGEEQTTSLTFEDTNASDVATEVQNEVDSAIINPLGLPLDYEDAGLSEGVIDALTPEVETVELPVNAEVQNGQEEVDKLNELFEMFNPAFTPEVDNSQVLMSLEEIEAFYQGLDGVTPFIDPQAAEELEKVAGETEKAAVAADNANGLFKELDGTFAAVVIGAKAAAGALTGAFAIASGLFAAAVASEGALVGFNRQLGDLAPKILDVDIQGFNGDLQQLAQYLGSSDEATLQVAQRFALLGQTAGATNEQIAQANSNLFAVAASIRSVNPEMGSLDAIANRLTTGFQRGGTALARLGINLTTNEIRARAAKNAGKELTDELSRFELAAAGAELASEKFGASIGRNIENALENPQIALARLKEILGDTLEEIGKPLVAPFLQVIEQGIPIVTGFSEVVASLVETALPLVERSLEAFVPLAESFFTALEGSFDALEPAFVQIGDALEALFVALVDLQPVFEILFEVIVGGVASGIAIFARSLELLIELFGGVGLAILGLIPIVLNFERILAANKIGLLLTGITIALGAIQAFSGEEFDPFVGVVESAFEAAEGVEGLLEALSNYDRELKKFVRDKELLKDPELVSALAEQGISFDQFVSVVEGGNDGIREFLRLTADDGVWDYWSVGGNKVEITSESVRGLTNTMVLQRFENQNLSGSLDFLRGKITEVRGSINETNREAFDLLVVEGMLGKQWRERAIELSTLADGTIDYSHALELAELELEAINRENQALAESSRETEKSLAEFSDRMSLLTVKIADGTIGLADLAEAAEIAGFEGQELSDAIQFVTDQIEEFTDSALSNVPSVGEVFSNLGDDFSAADAIAEFDKQIAATEQWNANMLRLRDEGQTDILRLVAELGPEQGNLLLAQYQDNEVQLAEHLKRMYQAEQDAKVAVREVAVLSWLELRGITGAAAEEVVQELRGKLTLSDATEGAIEDATAAVAERAPDLAAELADGVSQNVDALVVGSAEELQTKGAELNTAIEAVWNGAGGVAETASKVASEKAVEVFNNVVKMGFLDVATVEAIVVRATTAMTSGGFAAGSAFSIGVLAGLSVGGVQVFLRTKEIVDNVSASIAAPAFLAGRDLGAAIVRGMVEEINFANNDGVVSERVESLLNEVAERNLELASWTGNDLGTALIQGMESALIFGSSSISRLAAGIIAAAEQAARDEAESDSPSKAWERLGRDLVAGLSKGIVGSSASAISAASSTLGRVNEAGGNVSQTSISVTVPVTVSGNADPSVGAQIGRAAAAELRNVLRLEGRVA